MVKFYSAQTQNVSEEIKKLAPRAKTVKFVRDFSRLSLSEMMAVKNLDAMMLN